MSASSNRRAPPVAGKKPMMVLSSVDLPMPLWPRSPTTSPSPTASVTPCSTGTLPYPPRRSSIWSRAVMPSFPSPTPGVGEGKSHASLPSPQIDVAHGGIVEHLLDRGLDQHPALMEDGHHLRDVADEMHVVLNDDE